MSLFVGDSARSLCFVVQLDISKPFLCIGRLGANYLLMQPTHRAYRVRAGADGDDNSGNWLHTKIDICAGCFRGSYTAHLHIKDFARFRDELRDLDASVSPRATTNRTASFRSGHGGLRLTIEARVPEEYTATCEASDGTGSDTLLLFTLRFARAELPDIVHNLNSMLAEFPLKTGADD